MNASLLILTLALGADGMQQPAVPQSGLAGLISSTTSASRRHTRQPDVRARRRATRATVHRRDARNPHLAGGTGSDAAQLMDLIQTTIAPDSWQAAGGAGAIGVGPANPAAGGTVSARDQLIELIQEIEPESWDINGGPGSISVFGP